MLTKIRRAHSGRKHLSRVGGIATGQRAQRSRLGFENPVNHELDATAPRGGSQSKSYDTCT